MSFSQMVKILREENKEKIVFVNVGVFYIAVEEDAVLLNSKLKLKCTCFKEHTCKVGVPINVAEKHLKKIEELGYSYIVYNFDRERESLKVVKEFKGKPNKTTRKSINCLLCKGIKKYQDDVYIEALKKYYEQKIRDREAREL